MNGLERLARLGELGIGLPVIVVTGHGDIPTAVRAMKAGAVDFIEKPIDEARLFAAIDAALAERKPAGARSRSGTDERANGAPEPTRAADARSDRLQ
jgi:two-component system, LuxR family, response regulator FixJ